ncbi:cache domain-containing protein [Pseudodesulfovibrio piezophilus]|uniref:histidine kinase n=1 Tax=Pseudodesulfovibrio piezophilus (strain DSM 21447 / JCM 15486 / C1TLV30) TaxID=1322246 RepID=M1WXV2_PSEP2|nr:cache domain-containing protein [Pseudodesulfovibrio piezophilus]CCH49943.1 putative Signal transduction histidine kinase [Pseudodesulfovibrio piezophilus C1TLV30]
MFEVFHNLRIRNKLFLAYSFAFFLVFLIGGGIVYSQVRSIVQKSINTELTRTTETIRNMLRTSVDVSIRNYMRAVAEKNLELAGALHRQALRGLISEEEAKKRARDAFLSQTIGKTGHIYCLNSDGVMVVHPKRRLVGVDLSTQHFVKEQIRRKKGYLEYDWKEPLETVSRPKAISMAYFAPWDWIISATAYRDEFQKLVNISDFKKRILQLGFGQSGYPFVLDYNGNMLIHPFMEGKHFSEYGDPALSAIARRIISEREGQFEYQWKNPGEPQLRRKIVYFRAIPEMRWVVASSSYYDDFKKPLYAVRDVILMALAAGVLLMIPLSMWIGSIITRPLGGLGRSFARAADGDFSVRMTRQSGDELGTLALYFNSFMEKLTEYSESLQNEITVRKEAEEKLIALDKAKTLFLSSASHELRTPLTSIIGFLRLMEKNFTKRFQPYLSREPEMRSHATRFKDNLGVVRGEADRLGRLVNDLLDLNKIEAGHMEWRDEVLTVRSVLTRAGQAIEAQARQKAGVDFMVDTTEGGQSLLADADRLHQVLINLLNNAFKYTETGHVILGASRTKHELVFFVTDTGRGIPEEDQEKVFDIFYQVNDPNMRSSKVFGTGLGLAISRQIVQHYGGQMQVESTLGMGSTFKFTIPVGPVRG